MSDPRVVLYIEDSPSNIKLVAAILTERPEVRLVVANCGELGLELAREQRPALVLLDLNLPDLSGEEILRRMRNDPRLAETPIVIVSDDATPGEVERLLDIGANDYLAKPFGVDELLRVIDTAGDAAGAEPMGPQAPPSGAGVLDAGTIQALHELAGRRAVGPMMVRNIVDVYLADAYQQVAAMEGAIGVLDLAAITRQAHALRGASGGVGAAELAALCRQLEDAAREADVDAVRSVVARLVPALADTREALEAEFRPPVTPR